MQWSGIQIYGIYTRQAEVGNLRLWSTRLISEEGVLRSRVPAIWDFHSDVLLQNCFHQIYECHSVDTGSMLAFQIPFWVGAAPERNTAAVSRCYGVILFTISVIY